jgi:glyoxylase-like metal-dependent hydrolase (beta-lactamase superfamily II)
MQQTIPVKPDVKGFYESRTGSIQYVVSDAITGRSAIIDPVLDFDEKSGATATRSADMILDYVHENGLTVEWILDTHPHADHLSAAAQFRRRLSAAGNRTDGKLQWRRNKSHWFRIVLPRLH